MATNDAPTTANDVRLVTLTIHTQLSSSPVINIHGVRVNETIGAVKDRLRVVIPSHPVPSSMKLIYRGHRRNDQDTLEAVFTHEAVQSESSFTMHLVISDPASTQSLPASRSASRNAAPGGPVPQLANNGQMPLQQFQIPIFQGHPQAVPQLQPQGPNQMHIPPWPHFPQFQQQAHPFGQPQALYPAAFQQGPPPQQPQQDPDINAMVHNALQSSMDLSQRLQQQANRLREQLDQAPQDSQWERPRQLMDHVTGQLQVLQQTLSQNPGSGHPEFQAELDRLQERAQNLERELDLAPGADDQHVPPQQQPPMVNAQSANPQGTPMPNGAGPHQTFTRQGQGPNGSNWTFTSTTNFPFPPQQGLPQFMHPPPSMQGMPSTINSSGPPSRTGTDPQWLSASHAINLFDGRQIQLDDAIQGYHRLRNLMQQDSESNAQHELLVTRNRIRDLVQQRNAMQRTVNRVLSDGVPQGHSELTDEQVTELQSMSERFERSIRGFEQVDQTQREQLSGQAPGATQSSTSRQPTVAYLLSSPQGPQGIVYSPTGAFRTTPTPTPQRVPVPQAPNARPIPIVQQVPQPAATARPPQPTSTTAAPAIADPNRPADVSDIQDLRNQLERELAGMRTNNQAIRDILRTARGPAPAPAQHGQDPPLFPGGAAPQAQPPNAPADHNALPAGVHEHVVAINLTPFFQALWLFIRMYGIMWILMGGTGDSWTSWQFLTLIGTSILYWAYQAGYARQQVQDAVRWWEGLTGTRQPGQGQGQGPGQGAAARAAPGQPGQQPANLHGLQAANAALQSASGAPNAAPGTNVAQQQPRNAFREAIRPFEQTIALLFASLWPGVGERHVAERERLRREEAEREVQRRRQEEEARQRGVETAAAQGASNSGAADSREGSAAEKVTQPESGSAESGVISGRGQASSSAVAAHDTQQAGLTERRPGGGNAAGSDW